MAQNMRLRAIRVPDDLWDAAQTVATKRGESLSHVLRDLLRNYVERDGDVREEAT